MERKISDQYHLQEEIFKMKELLDLKEQKIQDCLVIFSKSKKAQK